MHGSDWTGEDVAGWSLSEKLDGWRCVWTGTEFLSRQGERFTAPSWFLEGMPGQVLDGELWAGPGTRHDQVNGAVRSGNWRALTFRPFDLPVPGLRFEEAQRILAGLTLPAHVRPVGQRCVASTGEAIQTMRRIRAAGGEGVMLRKPGSAYWADCRSMKLLKLTPGALARLDHRGAAAWSSTCPA
jgi:DNA ligase-1